MNSIIAKAFVFITETLSFLFIGLVLLSGILMYMSGSSAGEFFGVAIAIFGTLFIVVFFGLSAIMIENHKLLKDIRDSLKK